MVYGFGDQKTMCYGFASDHH